MLTANMFLLPLLQPHLQLLGGVFDMAAHPTVERFVNDPNITYRPLLFIPNDHSGKDMVL